MTYKQLLKMLGTHDDVLVTFIQSYLPRIEIRYKSIIFLCYWDDGTVTYFEQSSGFPYNKYIPKGHKIIWSKSRMYVKRPGYLPKCAWGALDLPVRSNYAT